MNEARIMKRHKEDDFTQFEDILNHIGQWGYVQKVQLLVLTSMLIATSFQNMGMVFLAGVPTHHCAVDENAKDTRLPTEMKNGKMTFSQCQVYGVDEKGNRPQNSTAKKTCRESVGHWQYDTTQFDNTIVSEWNLVCEDKWLSAFSKTVYFFGFFVGCLVLSDFSDRHGRRFTVLVTSVIQVIFAIAVFFAPNYTVFTMLRFVVGFATGGQRNSSYVLTQEWCTRDMRMPLQAFNFAVWAFSNVVLGLLAYYFRSWRQLVLVTSLPLIIFPMCYWIVYPSPRWLLTKGREEEALAILHEAARRNGHPLPFQFNIRKISFPQHKPTSILDLVRTPNMRKTSLIVWCAWLTVGMVSYGLVYNVGNMFGSIYTNFIIMSAVLFLRVPLVLALQTANRRLVIVCFAALCGITCLVVVHIGNGSPMASFIQACMGHLSCGMVFGLIYVYSIEVYPTSIRTIGLGTGSMWARAGSMMAPFVVLLADVTETLPFLVFGAASMLLAGLFLVVPETHNRRLVDTVEEAEKMNELKLRII